MHPKLFNTSTANIKVQAKECPGYNNDTNFRLCSVLCILSYRALNPCSAHLIPTVSSCLINTMEIINYFLCIQHSTRMNENIITSSICAMVCHVSPSLHQCIPLPNRNRISKRMHAQYSFEHPKKFLKDYTWYVIILL